MQVDISVIIPTCNRKEGLKKCLESLFTQDYPADRLEIIVVDDRSDKKTEDMIEGLRKQYSLLRYIAQSSRGPAQARNLGIKNSSGEITAFVDDDCTVDSHWARSMVETHRKNPGIAAVGGITRTSTKKTPVLVSQLLSTCSIETRVQGKKEIVFFPTCNVSFKRHVLDRYRFDARFPLPGGEDLEFFWRLFKGAHRFIWNKDIGVIHYREEGLLSFIKQAAIYGRGNILVQCIHKDHPLLKELKTGIISFWIATVVNVIKIPRFSYILGKRLIRESSIKRFDKKFSIYSYFIIHKIFYLLGNIIESFGMRRKTSDKGPVHMPRLLILDITHSCNLKCRICDIWQSGISEKDMNIFYIKKMLSQAKDLSIKEIALSGGEPLLRKDIFDILDYARAIKIKDLGILTNGILVDEYAERLKPYLTENVVSLVISLDSLRQDIHNHIRNTDITWQKTMKGLKSLSLLKKKHPQISFSIIAIILNQNLEELLDLAVFAKSLEANFLQYQPLLPNNLRMAERKRSPFWVTQERLPLLDDAVSKIIEFKRSHPGFIRNSTQNLSLIKKYYRGTVTSNDARCASARETILMSNQVKCSTCFSSYGDIKRQDFKDVFKGRERIKAQERVRKCSWPCLLPCFCDL